MIRLASPSIPIFAYKATADSDPDPDPDSDLDSDSEYLRLSRYFRSGPSRA
jgi:hypothetical protein